ncbi:MAG: 16S rRNA (uracil(1498)-N(3))-methyltransferase [Treponema sp.]|nr:16S rRNA (uracil(1498)-N(3))-methyltransferase [Treponema sp.]
MPDANGCVFVSGKKFHYLRSVLRLEIGDMIYVRLPNGALQQMTLAKFDASSKIAELTVAGEDSSNLVTGDGGNKALPVSHKSEVNLWLFQFIAKPPKMELIIRQAVECGVSVIVPVEGEFCQSGCIESARKRCLPSDARWQRIITEAREQSGSPVDTEILPCASVTEACRIWKNQVCSNEKESFSAVLYEQSAKTVLFHEAIGGAFQKTPRLSYAAVMVGAEGGISPSELNFVSQHGFMPVHFNTNILRCETASLYGMAVLQNAITESAVWQLKK